ncbi:ABC transporter substrate-binding protein [Celeribacter baekdonensis]|uniref:ABC transporter substrate-binding protein n=1 Tax=Celeribacter baekdonensis TaxID=875171 RepID=A0A2R4M2C4_9RHOB|nr:sugar ABC transporter substrate-binding protein [Celeribacter baekdonensis]AVW91325.1 ABC transporter substrate-binding protein [Celeribacter baekdonensis]
MKDTIQKKYFTSPTPLSRRTVLSGGMAVAVGAALGSGVLSARAYAQAGKTITVMMSQPQVGGARIVAEAFEKETGVKVEIVPVPLDQIQQQLTLDLQSGAKRFDAFDYWYISKGSLVETGVLEDITDRIEADKDEIQPEDFIATVYDPYSLYNGRRYALPFDGDTHALFYNTEIFARHGLSAPKTWDEVIAASEAITQAERANGIYGIALMGIRAPLQNISVFANRLANYGGEFLDAQGRPALNSEAALLAAQNLVDTVPSALPTPAETGFDQALTAFVGGRAAMTEGWIDLGAYSEDNANSKIAGKWDVVQLPVGGSNTESRAPLNAGWALGISAYGDNKDLAWEFIKLASSAKMHLELLTTTGSGIDPTRLSALTSDAYKAFNARSQRAASASLNGAMAWPTGPQAPRMLESLSEQLAIMITGESTPKDTMDLAQRSWERLLR